MLLANCCEEAEPSHMTKHMRRNVGAPRGVANVFREFVFTPVWPCEASLYNDSRHRDEYCNVNGLPGQPLLPRHGDANSILWLNQVIDCFSGFGDCKLHPFDFAVELVTARSVVRSNRRPAVQADITPIIG
jgi:hypothetical protein